MDIVGVVNTNIQQIVIQIWEFHQELFIIILAFDFCLEAKNVGPKKGPNLVKIGQNGSLPSLPIYWSYEIGLPLIVTRIDKLVL